MSLIHPAANWVLNSSWMGELNAEFSIQSPHPIEDFDSSNQLAFSYKTNVPSVLFCWAPLSLMPLSVPHHVIHCHSVWFQRVCGV